VWVFVNQVGNNHPVAASLEFKLETNHAQVAFPVLTNVSDPDGDSLSLVTIIPPFRGNAALNPNGTVTYTRTSYFPARDEFFTVLTDGRGGFRKRSVVILPQDDDGDEMPDEWELSNSLNASIADGLSDPDGDNVPNLAEYKLRTNPHVPDNPLHLDTIPFGQSFSNYDRVPLALNPRMDNQPISLLVNGNPGLSFLRQGADGTWYHSWDTGYMTNGNYTLTLSFQFNPTAQPPVAKTIAGEPRNVLVTNAVIFDQLHSVFSDIWYINITFAYLLADWRIELYDEDGSGLVYFEGTTTDGNVQGGWNLTFGGQQISFGNIRADVYVAPAGQGAAPTLPPVGAPGNKPNAQRWFTKASEGGISDKFVVAWGWSSYSPSFSQQRENLMLNGVINIIANPGLDDEYSLLPDPGSAFSCCAFRYDTPEDRDILMNALTRSDAGNFFWFGHGAEDNITGNAMKSTIADVDIENWLQNKAHRSKPPKYSYSNKHPYRLVILNGCKTYEAGWANAFGIDYSAAGSTNIVFEYLLTGRPPQAFVGWQGNVVVPTPADAALGWLKHAEYSQALAELFSRWMSYYPLEFCLDFYADTAIGYGFSEADTWKISGCTDLQRHDP
jgi:hypothetical protein